MDSFDNIPIWDGTPGSVSGSTAYHYYDDNASFVEDAQKFAIYATTKLGYPILNVELRSSNIYIGYEDAVTEYSRQINEFNASDNLLSLQGAPTSSNVTHKNIATNLSQMIRIAKTYGTETGIGGLVELHTGSLDVVAGQQLYDIQSLWGEASESGKRLEIRRVYHYGPPAVNKYFDPFAGNSAGVQGLMDEFGWGDMGIAMPFTMLPMYGDLLRIQAIELNDQVRKSNYGFQLLPVNKIRIFPKPDYDYKIWFEYTLSDDTNDPAPDYWNNYGSGSVSDISNAPFDLMEYDKINSIGKRWITSYAFANVKETLGYIRRKYSSIPIPGDDTTLDGDALTSEASEEKRELIDQLLDSLEKTSKQALTNRKAEEADNLNTVLSKVPLKFYIG